MPAPRGASCNRILAVLSLSFSLLLSLYEQGEDEDCGGGDFLEFQNLRARIPSYRSPGTPGQVAAAEVSDETHAPGSVPSSSLPLRTRRGTTSSVTCGCRKSGDHPAESYPSVSRERIRTRARICGIKRDPMTPLTRISGLGVSYMRASDRNRAFPLLCRS